MDFKERDPKLDKHLDEWLDDALAGYSKADPRPGLEQRITATLRAEDRAPARRRWWMFLTPAAAALAVLAITVSLHQKQGITPMPRNAPTSTEIATNESQPAVSVPEKDRADTPVKADKTATRVASAKPKEQPETRRDVQAPHLYAAAPAVVPPPPPVQQATSVQPAISLPKVAENRPSAAPISGAMGGVIGGTISPRSDSQSALNAPVKATGSDQQPRGRTYQALNTAPPPPLAKSEAEPRDAGRHYEAAPQIAATAIRPEKKTDTTTTSAANQTVEVCAACALVETQTSEVRSDQLAAAKRADKMSLAKTKAAPAEFYKLDFVLRELEDGKVVSLRNYSLMARSGDWQQLRVGTSAPTTAERKQLDNAEAIGLSVDCRIVPNSDGTAVLVTKADITSIANYASQYAANAVQPVHHVQMNTSAPVTLGKPSVLSGVDELNSKHRFELVVTVTKTK